MRTAAPRPTPARRARSICCTSARGSARGQAPGGAAVGRQADLGVRHHEARIGGGDDEVAGQREREAGAGRGAFDRGDHRLRIGADRLDRSGAGARASAAAPRRPAARRSSRPWRLPPAQKCAPSPRRTTARISSFGFGRAERLDAGGDDLRRQRVAGRRIADRQDERRAASLGEQLRGHGEAVSRRRWQRSDDTLGFIRGIVSRSAVAPRLREGPRGETPRARVIRSIPGPFSMRRASHTFHLRRCAPDAARPRPAMAMSFGRTVDRDDARPAARLHRQRGARRRRVAGARMRALAEPSRSSRAISEACRLAGTARGGDGTARQCLLRFAFALCLQHRLRHFLYEQRDAVSALDNVLPDSLGQRLVASDAVDHGVDFALPEPIECEGGDVRPSNPRRVKLRSVSND